ncbi:MAG: glutamate--tRNA ligase [bacterium]|nr:glutamate--tRNA ligase [bacterium]
MSDTMNAPRVRIAPSPSGFLHIGNAKTALVNWLFARGNKGTFVLRLEDTDAERTKEEYVDAVCEGLAWLGIDWDEGPAYSGGTERGEYGPYRQSLRKDLYLKEAQRLLDEGKAYKCFYTKEELEALREQNPGVDQPVRDKGKWRDASEEDIAAMGDAPYAVRFRVPEGITEIEDLIQGTVRVNNKEVEDFVIVRPNGAPVFHLAVVVDDGLMKISHIIRGDDHLTNTVRHVMLFNALGYAIPVFAHLPMVLDEAGKKYSKRLHGSNVLDWRDDGYLPETMLNYLALLGWTPPPPPVGEEAQEFFTPSELVEAFSIERLGASAGKFDMKKLQWLNGQHIRRLAPEELRDRLVPVLQKAGFDTGSRSEDWLTQMAVLCQEKIPTLNDVVAQVDYFFVEPKEYEAKPVKKQWSKEDSLDRMKTILALFHSVGEWSHDAIKAAFQAECEAKEMGLGKLVHPTRLALTGKSVGPGLFELTELLGKCESIVRIEKGIEYIKNMGDPSQ